MKTILSDISCMVICCFVNSWYFNAFISGAFPSEGECLPYIFFRCPESRSLHKMKADNPVQKSVFHLSESGFQ